MRILPGGLQVQTRLESTLLGLFFAALLSCGDANVVQVSIKILQDSWSLNFVDETLENLGAVVRPEAKADRLVDAGQRNHRKALTRSPGVP